MPADSDPTKTCFIAMPVSTSTAHAELFGDPEHWKHVLEALFVPAVEAAGFVPWRPVARGSHMIHAEIVRQLEQADMVLCDLSQNNPNVFFELGVRTSVNKPIALVRCDAKTPIPFDVSGINAHTYDPSLKAWNITGEREKLTDHLRDAESTCAGTNPMWKQFGLELKAQEPTSDDTKEGALLSVVSHQIGALTERLDELGFEIEDDRSLRVPSEYKLAQNRQLVRNDVTNAILTIAHKYRIQAHVDFDKKPIAVVVHSPLPSDQVPQTPRWIGFQKEVDEAFDLRDTRFQLIVDEVKNL